MQDDTNYQAFKQRIQSYLAEKQRHRFVDFSKRERRSDLPLSAIAAISGGKYMTHWQGIEVFKDPLDVVIYQQLIAELSPKTIFELGTYTGGTTLWMADLLKSLDIDGHIYTVDIDGTLPDNKVKKHPKITFIQGDLNRINSVFSDEILPRSPHPWLVIEDAHINVVGALEFFHNWMQSGDYFIVEDTNPDSPAISGMGLFEDMEYVPFGPGKLEELEQFMQVRGNDYRVDSYYTDMFGFNATWNWNGFLRRN